MASAGANAKGHIFTLSSRTKSIYSYYLVHILIGSLPSEHGRLLFLNAPRQPWRWGIVRLKHRLGFRGASEGVLLKCSRSQLVSRGVHPECTISVLTSEDPCWNNILSNVRPKGVTAKNTGLNIETMRSISTIPAISPFAAYF